MAEGAGQHHPLALAARQPPATLVEHALPAAGQCVVDVLGVGHPDRLLGLLTGQHAVRVDGVLEGAGEELAAGVADHDAAAHVVEGGAGEVDAVEPYPPRRTGPRLVERGDALALDLPLGARAAQGAALEPAVVVDGDGLGVGGQVATEPVGQRGGGLRHGADHDGEQARARDEPAGLVDQVARRPAAAAALRARATAAPARTAAIALRAETSARVTFWANSKKVRIGPTMNRP